MAANRGVATGLAIGAGNAIAVKIGGDSPGALAGGEFAKDAADGLGLVYLPFAAHLLAVAVEPLHDVMAVAEAAARLSLPDATAQAAMGPGGEVFQEQGVHPALETDMQLGDLALGKRDERHAGKPETLMEDGDIGLVAADTVRRFHQHDLELARLRVLQERLDARPQGDARARNGGVPAGPTTFHFSRAARSRQTRKWSSMEETL